MRLFRPHPLRHPLRPAYTRRARQRRSGRRFRRARPPQALAGFHRACLSALAPHATGVGFSTGGAPCGRDAVEPIRPLAPAGRPQPKHSPVERDGPDDSIAHDGEGDAAKRNAAKRLAVDRFDRPVPNALFAELLGFGLGSDDCRSGVGQCKGSAY